MSKPTSRLISPLTFEFPCFSTLPSAVGKCTFSPVVELLGKRWRLCLFPGGNNDKNEGFVSCFLDCLSSGRLNVFFRVLVINHISQRPDLSAKTYELQQCKYKEWKHREDNCSIVHGCGFPRFVARSILITEKASDLLVNGTLVLRPILGDLTTFLTLHNDEETSDLQMQVARSECSPQESDGKSSVSVLKAHKLVLSTYSEVFKAMFYGPMKESHRNTLVIEDFSHRSVQCMLDFCYSGKIDVEDYSALLELLVLSCKYQIKVLTTVCVVYLRDMLTDKNALDVRNIARTVSLTEFKATVMDFITDHRRIIKKGKRYLKVCDGELLAEILLRVVPAERKRISNKRYYHRI